MRSVCTGRALLTMIAIAVSFSAALAQEPKKEAKNAEVVAATRPKLSVAYRLEFTVREFEGGKRINDRNYTMVVGEGGYGRLRVGNRVPYVVGEAGGVKQTAYQDVGLNIDCRAMEGENGVALYVTVESSGVDAQGQASGTPVSPVFRQQRAQVDALVTLGKPTVIATMDDVVTNRRYEIEVKATKMK